MIVENQSIWYYSVYKYKGAIYLKVQKKISLMKMN